MRKILNQKIPFYFVFAILLTAAGGAVFAALNFREVVYNYNLTLPEYVQPQAAGAGLQYGSWPALSNADFFGKVRADFVRQNSDFIEVNLSEMKLSVYKKGVLEKTFAILTKGKPGSWWETPAGLYKIENKAKTLYSSFGNVYMPWSMPFQGNFVIHGWPYYRNGTPVSSQYSGGCIRLSTDDAKSIYDLAGVGLPVLVFDKDFDSDNFVYRQKPIEISGNNFLVADLKSNFVIEEKSPGEVVPIASLTKLMTALVAVEYINLDNTITITRDMLVKTSKPRFKIGEQFSAFELLYPLLLESSNEAAAAISEFLGQDRFVSLMNRKAQALGMKNSRFTDPSGMDAGNVSSAEDLFTLSQYLYHNRSFVLKLTTGRLNTSAYGSPEFAGLGNFNLFANNPDFIGGKVGKSNSSKETIISIFSLPVNGEKRPVAVIVLGTDDSKKDVETILDYVKAKY